ncbi:hypothetical protein QOZ94_002501 [Xanthobacter agilis]|uniref:Uncharacterized protein n=1 Tax=Xanthobacter agilis TaxID=47492 RepID=A0ABU0LEZ5_XANAG|nr:hypothetical protein [Xanthobacter agilis]
MVWDAVAAWDGRPGGSCVLRGVADRGRKWMMDRCGGVSKGRPKCEPAQWGRQKGKGPLTRRERPKSREETPKEGSGIAIGNAALHQYASIGHFHQAMRSQIV